MMKITILDRNTITTGDVSLSPIEAMGNVRIFDALPAEQVISAIGDSDAVIVNKAKITAEVWMLAKIFVSSVFLQRAKIISIRKRQRSAESSFAMSPGIPQAQSHSIPLPSSCILQATQMIMLLRSRVAIGQILPRSRIFLSPSVSLQAKRSAFSVLARSANR